MSDQAIVEENERLREALKKALLSAKDAPSSTVLQARCTQLADQVSALERRNAELVVAMEAMAKADCGQTDPHAGKLIADLREELTEAGRTIARLNEELDSRG